jgi:hypothetical protein
MQLTEHQISRKIIRQYRNNSKSNRKIVERDKTDTSNAQMRDHPLSWFVTDTLIERSGRVIVRGQISPLSELFYSKTEHCLI